MAETIQKQHQHLASLAEKIQSWFLRNQRDLPWRINRDPYRIWISEVMLQQTTVQAVIPYYDKFLQKFPQLSDLANSTLEEVYQSWAGLGYYSRARNLHASAKLLAKTGFPQNAEELMQLPGFGPYTSRAVSSLAFDEKVGVLDGNVIRVFTRLFGLKIRWWEPKSRQELQILADQLVKFAAPYHLNQGLMEIGATVCTPKNPTCLLCPISMDCTAFEMNLVAKLPLPKPRKKNEIWLWSPQIFLRKGKIAVLENDYAPFLRKQMIFPGTAKKLKCKPTKSQSKHNITHHEIYISAKSGKSAKLSPTVAKKFKWVEVKNLEKVNPSILLKKALQNILMLALLLPFLGACGTASTKSPATTDAQQAPKTLPNPEPNWKQITQFGENEQGSFSPQGDKIAFISRKRLSHQNTQLYEYLLETNSERRISFSDGSIESPIYFLDNSHLIYASTTDELKEHPELFYPRKESDPTPNDLYTADTYGHQIQRMGPMAGNQSHPNWITGSTNDLVFLSRTIQETSILKLNLNRMTQTLLFSEKLLLESPIASQDGKILWIEKDQTLKTSVINLKESKSEVRLLPLPIGMNQGLQWFNGSENQIIFATKTTSDSGGEIYQVNIFDLKTNCLSKVIESKNFIEDVRSSLKLKKLLLTSKVENQKQLFLIDFPEPFPPCFVR